MGPTERNRGESGASLLELMAVMAIVGLAVGMVTTDLRPAAAPLQNSAVLLESFFRNARAKAVSTTSAYRVVPAGSARVVTAYASSCSAGTWTSDPDLEFDLPEDVSISNTGWTVCFSSRGAAGSNEVVTLTHPTAGARQVEVFAGGSARIVP
jgi:Tfp pilus assembly protein FimT